MAVSKHSSKSAVPILSLSDVRSGIEMLENVFGFRVVSSSEAFGIVLELGDQRVSVVSGLSVPGAIRPHHLALSVANVDLAMRDCQSRGGELAQSMTPDGPLDIAEFWDNGVRYVFFDGPEGALIELCMKKGEIKDDTWGHGHIGILCSDLDQTKMQLVPHGADEIAGFSLQRSDGITEVSFMGQGASVLELFSPPNFPLEGGSEIAGGWIGILTM